MRELTDLFEGFDPTTLSVSVTQHALDLHERRRIRETLPEGRDDSMTFTIRIPYDVAREMQSVQRERNCTRNAALNYLLRQAVLARASGTSLPPPRALFNKRTTAPLDDPADSAQRHERIAALSEAPAVIPQERPKRLFAL